MATKAPAWTRRAAMPGAASFAGFGCARAATLTLANDLPATHSVNGRLQQAAPGPTDFYKPARALFGDEARGLSQKHAGAFV